MRIRIIRSTGLAEAEQEAVLDTEGLPDAPHIHALVREALGSCSRTPGYGAPGVRRYILAVDDRPPAYCAEPHLTSSQWELLDLLLGPAAR